VAEFWRSSRGGLQRTASVWTSQQNGIWGQTEQRPPSASRRQTSDERAFSSSVELPDLAAKKGALINLTLELPASAALFVGQQSAARKQSNLHRSS